jgi:serine/threonine-protein kinase RsbW
LPALRVLFEAVCHRAGLDAEVTSAILLSTHEAACNVIRHAHRDCPDAHIRMHCCITPASVEIRVDDEGPPFDIGSVPHLDPAEVRPGGRGVFLIRSLMDEVDCRPRPEGGNSLRLLKRLPAACARSDSSL